MKIFSCIFVKVLSVMQMLVAFALPFSIFLAKEISFKLISPFVILSLVSYSIIKLAYKSLLSTNNPADRKNIFSINKRFSNKMNGSVSDNGLDSIVLLEPTKKELNNILIKKRLKKLKSN